MKSFLETFGATPTVTARASGRVNLIGEHTDYNCGYVLPALIPQYTRVHLRPREDSQVRLVSPAFDDRWFEYTLGEELLGHHWADYAQGVTRILAAEGCPLTGFDASIESTVPVGSGLSSSAALNVALMRALRQAFAFPLDDVKLALLCQRVENDFVGAKVGIMDPMVISVGGENSALFLDTRDLSMRRIRIPTERMDLVVIHSGVSHRNVGGGYNTRRAECEEACRLLGISSLRELESGGREKIDELPEPLRRRARHVVTENDRVLAAARALEEGDAVTLGTLFGQSHRSMRDDYEVSVPEIDLLVELAEKNPACFGARLTGGGFGGSIVLLAHKNEGVEVAARLCRDYRERTRREAKILVPMAN